MNHGIELRILMTSFSQNHHRYITQKSHLFIRTVDIESERLLTDPRENDILFD
jgi:hypothetical protein